jgi:hypothetical protein
VGRRQIDEESPDELAEDENLLDVKMVETLGQESNSTNS